MQARTSEIQRLAKALESAGIKLGSVASSITGAAATAMIESLIDGERRGQVLADLAIGRMRAAGKLADLSMALAGRFTDHHALLCRLHLDRIAVFDDGAGGLDERIAGKAERWQRETGLLKTLPGFGDVVAWAWLAEIGPAPHLHFATHEKLASWVTLCPGIGRGTARCPPRALPRHRLARRRRHRPVDLAQYAARVLHHRPNEPGSSTPPTCHAWPVTPTSAPPC